jgi:multiple sugar transport system substrate-binding protein
MFISGRWSVPRFRDELKFKWDIARFPAGKAGSIVGIDGSGWAISTHSKHPDEAWKLIEYLASEESITRFTETGLIVPARRDVATSDVFLHPTLPPAHAEIYLEILDTGKTTPQIERWNEVVDTINTALEPVWNGNKKACTAMKAIQKDVEKLLD